MRPVFPRETNAEGDRIVKSFSPDSDVPSDEGGISWRKNKNLNDDSDTSWSPERSAKQKETSRKPAKKYSDTKSSEAGKPIKSTSSRPLGKSSKTTPAPLRMEEREAQGFPKFNRVNIQRKEKMVPREDESKLLRDPTVFPLFRIVKNQPDAKPSQMPPETTILDSKPAALTGSAPLKGPKFAPIIRPVELKPLTGLKIPPLRLVQLNRAPTKNKRDILLKPGGASEKSVAQGSQSSTKGLLGAKSKDTVWPRFRISTLSGSTGRKTLPTFSMVGSLAPKKKRLNMGSSLNAPVITQGVPTRVRANTTSRAVRWLEEQGAEVVIGNPLGETIDESSILDPTRKNGQNKNGKPFLGFMCQVCGDVFEREGNYRRHALSQHPNVLRIYQCPLCPSRLASARQYNDHLARSHKEGPPTLPCPYCDRMFKYSQARYSHVQKKHNKEILKRDSSDEETADD